MVRLWQLRGIPVIEQGGIYWVRYRGPIYATFPNSVGIDAERGEMEDILRKARIAGVRVPSPRRGISCGLHVVLPSEYSLDQISRKHRAQVKRGLDRCEVKVVDLDELLVEGLALNRDTLGRQQRHDEEFTDEKRWARFVRALRDTPGCLVSGAYLNGRLSAYLVECRDGSWLRLLYKNSRSSELIHGTNYALDYLAILRAAEDPSIHAVENGFSSLAGDSGVDSYKRHLGYLALPTQLAIYLHPAISPWAATRPAVKVAGAVASIHPRHGLPLAARVLEAALETRMPDRTETGRPGPQGCQQEASREFSRFRKPYPVILVSRLWDTLWNQGVRSALGRSANLVRRRLSPKPRDSAAGRIEIPRDQEILDLRPGEWVEVRSEAEILATLNAEKKCRGLLFSDDMLACVGRRYRVLRRVERIYLEESRQSRSLKNTVILEGAHCQGSAFGCDRYCYFFWREAWLRRARVNCLDEDAGAAETLNSLVVL